MAYARYGSDSDWYIFWETTKADSDAAATGHPEVKTAEVLAIWHADYRTAGSSFTYVQVREMPVTGIFSFIPGFQEGSRKLLRECMNEFIKEADDEYAKVS